MARAQAFEEGSILIWKLDRDVGYREGGQLPWEQTPLAELLTREDDSLPLSSIVPSLKDEVEGRLTPVSADKVRVDTDLSMSVHFFGDDSPQKASSGFDVPYGTVVRVGPLQLCVVFAEHAEALAAGEVTLPEIDPSYAAPQPPPPEPVIRDRRPITARDILERLPSRWLLVFVGLVFVILGAPVGYNAWLSFIHLPRVGVETTGNAEVAITRAGAVFRRSIEVDGYEYTCGPVSEPGGSDFQFTATYDADDPSRCRDSSYLGRLTQMEWFFVGLYLGALLLTILAILIRAYWRAHRERAFSEKVLDDGH